MKLQLKQTHNYSQTFRRSFPQPREAHKNGTKAEARPTVAKAIARLTPRPRADTAPASNSEHGLSKGT